MCRDVVMQCCAGLAATLVLSFNAAAQVYVYNFESPIVAGTTESTTANAAALGTTLNGQDGWVGATNINVETTGPGHAAGGAGIQVARAFLGNQASNATFSATSFNYDLTGLTSFGVEFIGTPGRLGGQVLVALGSGPAPVLNNRLGAVFGWDGGHFYVRKANFGASVSAVPLATDALNDWYLFRLNYDVSANGGDGSGDLLVKNLTDGETVFRPVLAGVNLGLLSLNASYQAPGTWDLLYMRHTGCSCGTRGGGDDDWAAIQEIVVDASCTPCEDFLADILGLICAGLLDTTSSAAVQAEVSGLIASTVTGAICAAGPGGGSEASCEAFLDSVLLGSLPLQQLSNLLD